MLIILILNCPPFNSPLHYAITYSDDQNIALDLIALGADINAKSTHYYETPLHRAVRSNRKLIVQKLLEVGALIEIDSSGQTPLDAAGIYGNHEIIQLLENYDVLPDIKEPECD